MLPTPPPPRLEPPSGPSAQFCPHPAFPLPSPHLEKPSCHQWEHKTAGAPPVSCQQRGPALSGACLSSGVTCSLHAPLMTFVHQLLLGVGSSKGLLKIRKLLFPNSQDLSSLPILPFHLPLSCPETSLFHNHPYEQLTCLSVGRPREATCQGCWCL